MNVRKILEVSICCDYLCQTINFILREDLCLGVHICFCIYFLSHSMFCNLQFFSLAFFFICSRDKQSKLPTVKHTFQKLAIFQIHATVASIENFLQGHQ